VSRVAEIAAFVRLAKGGLAPDTLGKAIRRRWPDATEAEVREALGRSADSPDADEKLAIDAAATAILRG
jgi:hypothetical protein